MATAIYDVEQIRVEFSVNTSVADYGPGTPSFTTHDPADIKVDALVICGVAVPWAGLYPPLQRAILELANEVEFA